MTPSPYTPPGLPAPAADALVAEARAARAHSYAPYSGFRVGAAVRTAGGKVYRGVNVESASYGLTTCAERVAIQTAVAAGERAFVAVAIDADTLAPTPPCGACRQVLAEFGDLEVLLAERGAGHRAHRLSELLPLSFGPRDLLGDEEALAARAPLTGPATGAGAPAGAGNGPLAGVVVLDLTRILAGPYATQKLGDMGATVWKVERPDGGDDTRAWGPPFHHGISTYFMAVNRSKRSITLDLKKGDAVLERLVKGCDVIVENFRPGTLEKLGWTWERIRALNPRAIFCSISGYGQEGRSRDRPSYDVIAQGESGAQEVTGDPDGPPMKFGLSIADLTAGQHAVEGILLALHRRERTGQGDRVDVALIDGMLALLTYQAQMSLTGGKRPRRLGNAHPSIVPYQAFRARDAWVNVGVGNEELWRKFCKAIARPELLQDARYTTNKDRVEHREPLIADLTRTFAAKDAADWLALLDAAGVPAGRIRDVPQALDDARAEGRGMVTTVTHPDAGPLPMVGNAVKLGSLGLAPTYGPPPRLGEHTAEVLASVGLAPHEVEALRRDGVVL